MGCPCDGYDCDLPDKKAILALYSRSSSTPPVLIQPNGKFKVYILLNSQTFSRRRVGNNVVFTLFPPFLLLPPRWSGSEDKLVVTYTM